MNSKAKAREPKSATDSKTKAREALIGGIVAVILSPIGLYIGYQFNEYVTKDRISIQHIEIVADGTWLPFPSQTVRLLNKSTDVWQDYLHQYSGLTPKQIDVFFKGRDLSKDDIKMALETLRGFVKHVDQMTARLSNYIDRLSKYSSGDTINDILKTDPDYAQMFALEGDAFIPKLRDSFRAQNAAIPLIKGLAQETIDILLGFKPQRTGDIILNLSLLNSGKTDGLLNGCGVLELINEHLRIPITSPITKVERGSAITIVYNIDKVRASTGQLDQLHHLIQKFSSSPYRITLYKTDGSTVTSDALTLPVD